MEILARAKRVDNGQLIEGRYCQHEFVKAAGELTEEEKAAATPVPLPPATGGGGGAEPQEPTHYVVIRDAIQTIGEKQMTVNDQTFVAPAAVFTEVVADTIKAFSGFDDKNDVKIFEGDKIRYQAGVSSFETYTVVFNNGEFTVSPQWLWGCNFTPFDKRKVEVI